jgi:hypothetical protein
MRRLLAILLLAPACKGAEEEITLYFPSQSSIDATNVIAFTAFEPIIVRPDSEVPEFVGCGEVGVFPPTRILDPDSLATFPDLGEVLRLRESQTFPFDGDWSVDVPEVDEDDPNNPWGAVLVYIEARGEVRAPDDQGGGQISATLLAGCYCARTLDGGHSDRRLDQTVKSACPLLGGDDGSQKQRSIDLVPVVAPEFKLAACTVQDLTSPRAQQVSPGPAVCVETVRCDDAPLATDCFECQQPCDELSDMSNVPVMFTIDQPGGASEPKTQVVLTNEEGLARGQLRVDGCETAVGIEAQIVGRSDDPVRFDVQCVEPVARFNCGNERRLVQGIEPSRMSLLPGGDGPDFVAVLYDDGQSALLSVVNPTIPGTEETIVFEYTNETPRAVHGFYYELANERRPVLAVATSAGDQLKLYLYDWNGSTLLLQDTGAIVEDCNSWYCGTLGACDQGTCEAPESCATPFDLCMEPPGVCNLKVEFQTEVSMSHHDIDGDGRADLAIGTNSDIPMTTYFSGKSSGNDIYLAQGCACSQFGQAPSAFELINIGGSQVPSIDMVIGAPGGAFVRYAQELSVGSSALTCGQACRFGDLVPVRDVAKGHFQCNANTELCPFDDVVLVAAKSLGGGSFDDPGTIRVIYGEGVDFCPMEDLFSIAGSNVELIPRKLEGQSDPSDPRTAEVGDFNTDGHDDLAVLFGSSEEVHVWLGASNKGLGEVEMGIVLADCELAVSPEEKCNPLRDFALPDFDNDGKADVAVICKQGGDNRLRWYTPGVE